MAALAPFPPAHTKLVVVSANAEDSADWADRLAGSGFSTTPVGDPIAALRLLGNGDYAAVLVRLPAPCWSAEEMLEEMHRVSPDTAVVLMDGAGSELRLVDAVRLLKLGAYHFLDREADLNEVAGVLTSAAECWRARRGASAPATGEQWRALLVGDSSAMETIAHTVRLIGNRRCTVLITGETGTGKEMVARAIHLASSRSNLAPVAVNCSALPENLLEAELFGHVKGAFTGAIAHRVGRFEQAHRSTLFLDEVADMPLELQAKLLRVLQEREFQRLGSSETVRVDVRVIAASNVDLLERVRQGRFREDLYYRINVVPISVPPLRQRPRDIPLLVRHFLEKICRQEGMTVKMVTPETLERLCRYGWPGNVRQLENAVEMAVALSGDRGMLYPGDFPLPSVASTKPLAEPLAPHIAVPDEGLDFERTVGQIELSLLEQALRKSGGNKKQAADLLRLKRTTLAAKLKSLETSAAAS